MTRPTKQRVIKMGIRPTDEKGGVRLRRGRDVWARPDIHAYIQKRKVDSHNNVSIYIPVPDRVYKPFCVFPQLGQQDQVSPNPSPQRPLLQEDEPVPTAHQTACISVKRKKQRS
jgi:hypothetical protein